MKIAIYYPWIYLTSGVERTILETTKFKEHQFTLFTNHYDQNNTYPEFNKLNIIQLKKVPIRRGIPSVLKAAIIIATQKIDLNKFDLLIIHNDGLGDLILNRNHSLTTICICHTPLRPVFDEYYREEILQNKPLSYKLIFHAFAQIFRLIDRRLWPHYTHVFFNSRETLRRAKIGGLIKYLQKDQYQILHPGVNWHKTKSKKTFKPYFLLPGRIMWTKNIELGIKSFINFKKEFRSNNFKLIIAGRVDLKSKSYLHILRTLSKDRKDITFIINPSEQQMNKLYQECWTVISCAFNEDWGLTLLEGNSYAKPVIAVNQGGPRESQIHKQTGLLVKPSIKDFSNAMHILAFNPTLTNDLGKNARINVKQYSWYNFRSQLNNVIRSLSVS